VPAPRRPVALRGRVFRKRDVVASGLLTPAELRSSAWRRLYRGVYADAELPDSFAVRVSGARLLVPPEAVFSGRTAAGLHGATDLVDARTPVEVSVPADVRFGPVAGLRVRQVTVDPLEVVEVRRLPCTTPARTAMDIARAEPLLEGVVALDVLLASKVVDHAQLRAAAAVPPARRGARRAARGRAVCFDILEFRAARAGGAGRDSAPPIGGRARRDSSTRVACLAAILDGVPYVRRHRDPDRRESGRAVAGSRRRGDRRHVCRSAI